MGTLEGEGFALGERGSKWREIGLGDHTSRGLHPKRGQKFMFGKEHGGWKQPSKKL